MSVKNAALAAVPFALALAGCATAPGLTLEASEPSIIIQRPALFPETVAYDGESDGFLLSSLREGAVFRLDRSGKAAVAVRDPRLCSVLGIAIDEERGRIWAVNSNLGASAKSCISGPKQLAGVGIYDLSTGAPIDYIDLAPLVAGPHLLNGIALDASGNAYVTDSFSPVIYRIDEQSRASVFLRDERFAGEGINLNGVVVHPDGYLLVVKKNDGKLFRVPLADPTRFSTVAVDERFIGGDGVTLIGKSELVLIANQVPGKAANAAFALSSADGWRSAKLGAVRQLGDVYPTTAVLAGNSIYVLSARLNVLIQGGAKADALSKLQAALRPIGSVAH